jgi:hypothetical protein
VVAVGAVPPTPWEDLKLTIAEGKRVIVGAAAYAGRVAEAVAAGDRAAAVVDRFVMSGAPPQRYIVYLADTAEWNRWFAGGGGQALGYALQFGLTYQVVLNMDALKKQSMPLQTLMQHELGHVATLTGSRRGAPPWLTEGIAEYIAYHGRPLSASSRTSLARQWIRSHGWTSTRSLPDYDRRSADVTRVNVFYGASHVMVRCLVSRYGEAKMLRFFKMVASDDKSEYDASPAVFGADWDRVDRGCASFVRNA